MGVVKLIYKFTIPHASFNLLYCIYIFDLVGKKSQNYFAQTNGNDFEEPH